MNTEDSRQSTTDSTPDHDGWSWRDLPKAETHVHLEGSIDLELITLLHERHDLPWKGLNPYQVREHLAFSDFPGFLESFKQVCLSVRAETDYIDITRSFFQRLADQNIIHCEFFYTPAISERFGLRSQRVLETILATASEEGARRGISWAVILDNVRQFPDEDFHQTLNLALRYRDEGVAGIGVGGDELSRSLSPLSAEFSKAREMGLRIHLHTGETGSAASMMADIHVAGPHRIGHGLPAAYSAPVRDLVLKTGAVIDLNLTSNWLTGVVDPLEAHPGLEIIRAGIPFTLGTDDPVLFQTSLDREYGLMDTIWGSSDWGGECYRWQVANPLLPQRQRAVLALTRERLISRVRRNG